MLDAASPCYGHSLKGQHCVEVMRRMESPNITLNLLCGADGITYANTVDGASNMFTFLNSLKKRHMLSRRMDGQL